MRVDELGEGEGGRALADDREQRRAREHLTARCEAPRRDPPTGAIGPADGPIEQLRLAVRERVERLADHGRLGARAADPADDGAVGRDERVVALPRRGRALDPDDGREARTACRSAARRPASIRTSSGSCSTPAVEPGRGCAGPGTGWAYSASPTSSSAGPDLVRRDRHLEVADAGVRERVDDRVDVRGRRADRGGLARRPWRRAGDAATASRSRRARTPASPTAVGIR